VAYQAKRLGACKPSAVAVMPDESLTSRLDQLEIRLESLVLDERSLFLKTCNQTCEQLIVRLVNDAFGANLELHKDSSDSSAPKGHCRHVTFDSSRHKCLVRREIGVRKNYESLKVTIGAFITPSRFKSTAVNTFIASIHKTTIC
jgi:hypothetical protein